MTLGPTAQEVGTADGPMPAHLWWPQDEPHGASAGLVVVQEIFGVSDYIKDRCADLAALGYAVLAPEVYWRLGGVVIDESSPDFLEQAIGYAGQVDWSLAVEDVRAALGHLHGSPGIERVGLVGFCFGGGLAFDAAAHDDPSVLVSYYGSALPTLLDLAPEVTCPSLHHFGTDDAYIPAEEVARIRAAVTGDGQRRDVELHLHDGAGHAFDNPHPAFHHPAASATAWGQTREFLQRHLPT